MEAMEVNFNDYVQHGSGESNLNSPSRDTGDISRLSGHNVYLWNGATAEKFNGIKIHFHNILLLCSGK